MRSVIPRRLPTLLLLSCAIPLTACGGNERPATVSDVVVRQNYTVAEPDPRLRTCADRPARRPINNQNDVAAVLNEAFAYGDDCAAKLGATWRSIDDAKARADKLNAEEQERHPLPEDPD